MKKVLISFDDIDRLYKAMCDKTDLNDFWAGYAKCTADLLDWFAAQPDASHMQDEAIKQYKGSDEPTGCD